MRGKGSPITREQMAAWLFQAAIGPEVPHLSPLEHQIPATREHWLRAADAALAYAAERERAAVERCSKALEAQADVTITEEDALAFRGAALLVRTLTPPPPTAG